MFRHLGLVVVGWNGRIVEHAYRLLLVSFLALSYSGCSSESSPASEPSGNADEDSAPRIALVMKSLANEFFVTMADGARAHHADSVGTEGEYELIVNGIKDESDIGQQVMLIEQMLATGVDAIVLAPADSKALVPISKRVLDAGVVLVNIDNRLDEDTLEESGIHVPFVGPNNRSGAQSVGEVLSVRLSEGDEVAIIEGIPTAFNAQERRAGFEAAIGAVGAKLVDAQSGGWEQAKANTVAAAMLREHPNLKAILCANDNMALGAAAAIRQSGREDPVLLVGFDNIDAVRTLVESGEVLATADQHAGKLAVFGIETALQWLESGDEAASDRETPVDVVTRESLSAASESQD